MDPEPYLDYFLTSAPQLPALTWKDFARNLQHRAKGISRRDSLEKKVLKTNTGLSEIGRQNKTGR